MFHLMRFVAHQLRAHEDIVMGDVDMDRSADLPRIPPQVEQEEQPHWDEPWDSDDDPAEEPRIINIDA